MNEEKWWRFDDHLEGSGSTDVCGEFIPGPSYVRVHCSAFPVLKHTAKGVWLSVYGERRFVLRSARKRFACPTIDEARVSFIARKTRQAGIFEKRANDAHRAIEIAKAQALRPNLFGGFTL